MKTRRIERKTTSLDRRPRIGARLRRCGRQLRAAALAAAAIIATAAQGQRTVYAFTVKDAAGQDVELAKYRGKVLLIVNTATACGFTPQYADLEALYEEFRDRGLEVLDFPCNQFGGQAPGSIAEIHAFCTGNYGTTFPQFDKIEVNGAGASPLYVWLKRKRGFGGWGADTPMSKALDGMLRQADPAYDQKADIKWNFTKFLISRRGKVVARFEPTAPMEAVREAVAAQLK